MSWIHIQPIVYISIYIVPGLYIAIYVEIVEETSQCLFHVSFLILFSFLECMSANVNDLMVMLSYGLVLQLWCFWKKKMFSLVSRIVTMVIMVIIILSILSVMKAQCWLPWSSVMGCLSCVEIHLSSKLLFIAAQWRKEMFYFLSLTNKSNCTIQNYTITHSV